MSRWTAIALVASSCLAGCSESASSHVPGARELTEREVLLAGHDITSVEDGFAVVWGEVMSREATELRMMRLDASGTPREPSQLVAVLEDYRWPEFKLLRTPTGFAVWYWQARRTPRAVILDDRGAELATAEWDRSLASSSQAADAAIIGDAVAVVVRDENGVIWFRLFNDQGVPRTDATRLQGGGNPVVVASDRFELLWSDSPNVWRAVVSPQGEVLIPAATIATEGETSMWDVVASPVEGGLFLGWKRAVPPQEGAAYTYFRDDESGWPEPRTLFAPNRRESLDIYLGRSGSDVLVGWQSDAEHAVRQLNLGTIDPSLGVTLSEETALTPVGLPASRIRFAEGAQSTLASFRVTADGASRLVVRPVP